MESVVFIFSLIDCCALIFLSVYFWVIPELIGHTIVTVLMLISLHWFIFLLNLPVATWNIYRYIMVPSGNMGVFDPTEIHNRGQLKSHMKEAMIKLGFHLLCFFMYLYRHSQPEFISCCRFSGLCGRGLGIVGPDVSAVAVTGILRGITQKDGVLSVSSMILALIND